MHPYSQTPILYEILIHTYNSSKLPYFNTTQTLTL